MPTNPGTSSFVSSALLAATLMCRIATTVEAADALVTLRTDSATFIVDAKGALTGILRNSDGHNYLATGHPAPVLSIRQSGALYPPESAAWDAGANRLELRYAGGKVTAIVMARVKPTHIVFEVVETQSKDPVDVVLWGPYPIMINKTVGEVIGVVRDGDYAVGLQALNVKTQAGPADTEEGDTDRPYAASQTPWGSLLQAHSRDRSRPRAFAVWNGRAPNMPVPAIPGETVLGSRIALFGCADARALETIGEIEVAEGLPHPLIDGVWAKLSPQMGRSYLIADYSEADIDEMLGYVKRANLMSLYHGDAFKSWGHYEPSPKFFPTGVAGWRACSEKAKAMGIRLGAHTLSNFIQTQDEYISPVPDPRLCKTGASTLTQAVDAGATEIPVESPEYFTQVRGNEMRTVVIGTELVRYRSVSPAAPWKLLDCERGAFRTATSPHPKGAAVAKLMDHAYKVFFPNFEMQREIAVNLARRYNEAGLSHLDFDGHEGCLAPGQGTFGKDVFAKDFYDHFEGSVIIGTSPPLSHYYWHINSYCNWGEPWYGGFRDSMQEYRLNNQAFFARNFIPKMLGWYRLTHTTIRSDMEWMLARAAGFNAGFALATSPAALRKNPGTGPILDAIREWEEARHSGAFSNAQREQLRNPKKEFHLEAVAAGEWNLFALRESPEFHHERLVRQPGEPTSVEWNVPNPNDTQELQFKLRVPGEGGSITDPVFEIDRAVTLAVPVEVAAGQTLLLERDAIARVYDAKGNQIKSVQLPAKPPLLKRGTNRIDFDCEFQGDPAPKVVVTFKTVNPAERVGKPQ